jgi:hypothetical protein
VAAQVDSKSVGEAGCSSRRGISPLLSSLYVNKVDRMLERAKEVTRREGRTVIEYARFADDMVGLVISDSPARLASEGD